MVCLSLRSSKFKRNISSTMNIKNIRVTIFIALQFILLHICFCCTDNNTLFDLHDSHMEEESIISAIIPDCVFGVESVTYFLYTRDKPLGIEVHMNDSRIPMRAKKTVVFLVHGFISEANNSNYFELVTAWLKKEDINIFSLDWADAACSNGFSLTDLLAYKSAVNNVPVVGKYLSDFAVKLTKEYKVNVNEMLVVGHSLGAHVAGFSGKYVQKMVQQKYNQIVGLDPAGPEFMNKDCAHRLCHSDAAFVQIFHTSYLAGIHNPIGDKDFYFNGGAAQPGCVFTGCSHSRAVIYLTRSLQYSSCFIGTYWKVGSESMLNWKQCNPNNCAYPGLDTSKKISKSTYYVVTACGEPFCTV